MQESKPNAVGAPKSWLHNHSSSIVVLGVILLLIFMQWPFLKGIVYRITGAGAVDHIAWRTDYVAALDEARATGKPLLIDFGASWCPPCQVMKHEVWPDKRVEQIANERFIPVYIDTDLQQERALTFELSSIPTIIATSSAGATLKRGGFMSASEMVVFMNDALKMHSPATQSTVEVTTPAP